MFGVNGEWYSWFDDLCVRNDNYDLSDRIAVKYKVTLILPVRPFVCLSVCLSLFLSFILYLQTDSLISNSL